MKKLLSATLALTMGVSCVVGFTACGGSKDAGKSDAEIAKAAIETVVSYHANDPVENNASYKVLGKTRVDGTLYDVKWSVSSASFNNLSDYVTVSETLDTSNKYTVNVTLADTVIEYKLTASVTVGKETETHDFDKKVSKKAAEAAGTLNDPFSVAKVLEIGATLEAGAYYTGSGTNPLQVYVEGYVVDAGTQFNAGRASNVYIVDEYSADKNKSSEGALQVYSITYDDTYIQQLGDIAKGDKLKLYGFIQFYQPKSGSPTLELTYLPKGTANNDADISVVCVAKTDARNGDQKIADALAKVGDLTVNKAGDYELPAPTVSDVNYVWSTADTTYTITEDGKHLKVDALPTEADATVEVKVTASCGTATPVEKTITVTIKKAEQLAEGEVALNLSFDTIGAKDANDKSWGGYGEYEVSFEAAGASVDGTITFSRASKQSGTITNYPVIAANASTEYVTVALASGTIGAVEFNLLQWTTKVFADIHIEYFNGTAWVKCSDVITTPAKLASTGTLPEGVQYVRVSINTATAQNTQVGLTSIKLVTDPDGVSSLNPPTGSEGGDSGSTTPSTPTTGKFTAITAPVAGDYYFAMTSNEKLYYFVGSLSGTYLATTTNVAEAAKVTLVADGEGWLLKVGNKFLELVVEVSSSNGKTYSNPKLNDAQTDNGHWMWNDEFKIFTWTTTQGTYWLGTTTYTTMSANDLGYLTGELNTTKAQNPAHLGTISEN